jgi:hypothetical protein
MWLNKVLLGVVVLALPGQAAIARVNSTSGYFTGGGAGASSVSTAPFNVSAGSLVVCNGIWLSQAVNVSFSDLNGESFILEDLINVGLWGVSSGQWFVKNTIANASQVITMTPTIPLGFMWVACRQYSGADTVNPQDPVSIGIGSNNVQACGSDAMTTSSFNTSFTGDVIVAGFGIQFPTASPLVGSGYTLGNSTGDFTLWMEDLVPSGVLSGTVSTFGTTTCNFYSAVAGAYKAAGSAPVAHSTKQSN